MQPFSRRGFLRSFALGGLTLPAWFPRVAFSEAPSNQRDVLVCLFLRGGADALNVVVPFGDDDYYRSRPKLAFRPPGSSADAALDLDGFFGFHPLLAPLKELYDDGVLAVVHAIGSPDRTHSHFDAMDFMERGTPGSKSIPTGWIGRHLASLDTGNGSPFRAVGMGSILQFSLRGPVQATALRSIADSISRACRDRTPASRASRPPSPPSTPAMHGSTSRRSRPWRRSPLWLRPTPAPMRRATAPAIRKASSAWP